MIGGKSVLAVIPARGTSKRLPGKNLMKYRGKTLLQWAIRHAEMCRYVDRIVVSTENPMIAKAAGIYHLPRPAFLSTDATSGEAVLAHALYCVPGFDYAVLLQPTSPNRVPEDINACIEIAHRYHSTAEKYEVRPSMHGCISVNEEGRRNGAVYVAATEEFLAWLSWEKCNQYKMPNSRSLDIDHLIDFEK